MKKIIGITTTVMMLLATVFIINAYAQDKFLAYEEDNDKSEKQTEVQKQTFQGPRFVDADGDGVCDNNRKGKRGRRHNGQGGQGGQGKNFVDKDGDGVCDNYNNSRGNRGRGRGNGTGRGR